MTDKMRPNIDRVAGGPQKDFFVNMLTRDIDLSDAILDLLDNSVDGALRMLNEDSKPSDSLEGYWAKITFTEERFTLEDNCGGIPWALAEKYAFAMGKPNDYERPKGTIGLVGIGMKRAIFKIGRECFVHSHHKEETFMVEIPPVWFSNDMWEFDARREKSASKQHGTIIEINKLVDPVRLAFRENSEFANRFKETIEESYAFLIEKGFEVTVNGKKVKPKPIKIYFSDSPSKEAIKPFLYSGTFEGVDVFFAVGYRTPLKTQEELESDSSGSFSVKDAGWTVVCNDRVVLANDRSHTTGWGFGGVPAFHNQFSSIAGFVEFKSSDPGLLPITTTKRGVDATKEVFVLVRQKMQEATKVFTSNTNNWKGSEKEIKEQFKHTQAVPVTQLKGRAKTVPFARLPGKHDQQQHKPFLPQKKQSQTTRRISFNRLIEEIEAVSHYFFDENRSPAEVGEKCFNYVLEKAKQ